jgi:hypothetical protein
MGWLADGICAMYKQKVLNRFLSANIQAKWRQKAPEKVM